MCRNETRTNLMTATHFLASVRRLRAVYAIGYLMFGMVALRELTGAGDADRRLIVGLLLAAMLILHLGHNPLFGRWPAARLPYFVVQTLLIQALGLLPPHQDVWGLLYVLVAVQAHEALPARAALAWAGVAAAAMMLTLMGTMGAMAGLGFGLTYLAAGLVIVSWEAYSAQAVAGQAQSQALLLELQDAHRRLQAYAGQIEAQTALRERDRLAHELHDSVGQTLFGVNLTTESARVLLARDPAAAAEQIAHLQTLTAGALREMRGLIAQWRPG
jgi:signal transduction histidine kinase